MSGTLSETTPSAASPQPVLSDATNNNPDWVYERLLRARNLELKRGHGFSAPRLILTLTHKYGHSMDAAKAAVEKYVQVMKRLKGESKVEADLYPGNFNVTPVMSVFAKLAAVKTATRLMARTTPMTRTAERGLKSIIDLARKLDFKVKTTQNRAFYTTELRCDDEDYSLYVMGWHGTGMFAGGEKAILEFYDSREGERPVLTIGALTDANLTAPNEQKLVDHILTYIKQC